MHPILFEIGSFTAHSYGFCIMLGAILATYFTYKQANKQFGIDLDKIYSLLILIVITAFIGGKLFLIFENPAYFIANPMALLGGDGFVFFGSLLTSIPAMIWFFKKNNLPILPMFDVMAITACIVHAFGRLGCFMAGCCNGIEWHGPLAVTFTDPMCSAEPMNTPLHPTQLYSMFMIGSIGLILFFIKKKYQKFDGQLFLIYLILYSIGRSIIEVFRGDEERGFIIENVISHSQFISILVIIGVCFVYLKLSKTSPQSPK